MTTPFSPSFPRLYLLWIDLAVVTGRACVFPLPSVWIAVLQTLLVSHLFGVLQVR